MSRKLCVLIKDIRLSTDTHFQFVLYTLLYTSGDSSYVLPIWEREKSSLSSFVRRETSRFFPEAILVRGEKQDCGSSIFLNICGPSSCELSALILGFPSLCAILVLVARVSDLGDTGLAEAFTSHVMRLNPATRPRCGVLYI